MTGWHFIATQNGWEWHHVSSIGRLTRSGRPFVTLLECTKDAAANGYCTSGNHSSRPTPNPEKRT
jgi:hypothetical protein